jgi:hypothetical protein
VAPFHCLNQQANLHVSFENYATQILNFLCIYLLFKTSLVQHRGAAFILPGNLNVLRNSADFETIIKWFILILNAQFSFLLYCAFLCCLTTERTAIKGLNPQQ